MVDLKLSVCQPNRCRSGFSLRRSLLGLLILHLTAVTGCAKVGGLLYMIKGRDLPAEFPALMDKKVAVVVTSDSGSHRDATSVVMAHQVHRILSNKVKKIRLANPEEVEQVLSDQPAGPKNLSKVGKQLDVDYVISVQIQNLRLRDGATMYRGQCDCSVDVFEMAKGDMPVFRKQLPQFIYPTSGVGITDMEEPKFQGMYLTVLSTRVARSFHPYDPHSDFGIDAAAIHVDR
ncbi:MAG: hypothetical protein WCI02_11715 [Planctomycetota bacterium]|jgi:hypothetical protein